MPRGDRGWPRPWDRSCPETSCWRGPAPGNFTWQSPPKRAGSSMPMPRSAGSCWPRLRSPGRSNAAGGSPPNRTLVMATIVFTALGTALGGPLGGALGSLVGSQIDRAVLGGGGGRREGPRLRELAVTTSSYGTPLPRHFGTMRAPGTIIWATDLVETSETSGGKGR